MLSASSLSSSSLSSAPAINLTIVTIIAEAAAVLLGRVSCIAVLKLLPAPRRISSDSCRSSHSEQSVDHSLSERGQSNEDGVRRQVQRHHH